MHRSRDIQVEIFEPWDWVYFLALPSWAWAEICQKVVQTPFVMVLNTGISVLRKFMLKNLQKSYLERVRFRTQSQHFQATDRKFRPYSWEIDST
jgi:hypothetical protein